MAFFLPSLRASSSSSSSTAAACCSSAPLSRRTVIHHPRLPNPPKYKAKMHPEGFSEPLAESSPGANDGGATFVFNPAPSVASVRSVTTLEPNLSPNGRRMPAGWAKVPGFGFMAPRVDRLIDGTKEAEQSSWVSPKPTREIQRKLAELRRADPIKNSVNQLSKRFGLHPTVVARYAPAPPGFMHQRALDTSAAIERMPIGRLVKLEGRVIRRSQEQ